MAERRQNAGPIGSQRKTYDQRVSDPLIGGRSPSIFPCGKASYGAWAGPGGLGPVGPDLQGRETAKNRGGPGPHRPRVDPGETLGPKGLTLTEDTGKETASRQVGSTKRPSDGTRRRQAPGKPRQEAEPVEEPHGAEQSSADDDRTRPGRGQTTHHCRLRRGHRKARAGGPSQRDDGWNRFRPARGKNTRVVNTRRKLRGNRERRKAKPESEPVAANPRRERGGTAARYGSTNASSRAQARRRGTAERGEATTDRPRPSRQTPRPATRRTRAR